MEDLFTIRVPESQRHTAMTSARGLTGLWILTLIILLVATLGETKSPESRGPNIPFPPACPTSLNQRNICEKGQNRPRYPERFLPPTGWSYLRRYARAVNRLENWYSLCCRGQVAQGQSQILCCTKQAWKQTLSQFCVEEYATKTTVHECCEKKGDDRWNCFNSGLPNPNYDGKLDYTAPPMPPTPGFTFNHNAC